MINSKIIYPPAKAVMGPGSLQDFLDKFIPNMNAIDAYILPDDIKHVGGEEAQVAYEPRYVADIIKRLHIICKCKL